MKKTLLTILAVAALAATQAQANDRSSKSELANNLLFEVDAALAAAQNETYNGSVVVDNLATLQRRAEGLLESVQQNYSVSEQRSDLDAVNRIYNITQDSAYRAGVSQNVTQPLSQASYILDDLQAAISTPYGVGGHVTRGPIYNNGSYGYNPYYYRDSCSLQYRAYYGAGGEYVYVCNNGRIYPRNRGIRRVTGYPFGGYRSTGNYGNNGHHHRVGGGRGRPIRRVTGGGRSYGRSYSRRTSGRRISRVSNY